MAKNFVQSGESITVEAPAGGVDSGQGLQIGAALFGVCQNSAAAGEDVELMTEGVYVLPKLASDDVAAGALVYWDAANTRLTITAGTLLVAGIATAAAAGGVANVTVKINRGFA